MLERDMDFAKNWKIHVDEYVWSEVDGQEVDKRCIAYVVLEWNHRSACKSQWCPLVWTCDKIG